MLASRTSIPAPTQRTYSSPGRCDDPFAALALQWADPLVLACPDTLLHSKTEPKCHSIRKWPRHPTPASGASVTQANPVFEVGESHGSLTVDNFQAPGRAACLHRASPYPPVSPGLQTVHQVEFGPSWRNPCARMAQFRELAGTPGADTADPYCVSGVFPAYNWRTAIQCLYST
jgi:hypothetical protein